MIRISVLKKNFLSILLMLFFFNIFCADFKYSEQEFLELVNDELIETDLKQLLDNIEAENITKNENENTIEEVSAVPELLTEIGGLEVPSSDYAQSMIRKYMNMYNTEKGQKTLNYVLESGEDYRIFIRHKLAEYNLPRALEYLPVVESEFKVTATSKSGAKGLWQFMENSIKPYLKKNDWIDERLDPWKSTDAALKKLQENYTMFNDWALALAAYNCGAGAMKKITKAHPEMSFWELAEQGYLKKQTVHYVPKLLGITELAESPEKYELNLPVIADDSEIKQYDFVSTKKPINISKLAKEIQIDFKTLKNLNPSLTRIVTPPSIDFQIRLPLGMGEIGQQAVEKLQKDIKGNELLFVEHKISSGDTLWGLSRIYGCKVDDICDLNGITQKTILKLGKIIFVPLK